MNRLDPGARRARQNGSMAVLPQTPEVTDDPDEDAAELAELRRRAYGPGADIADDPAARARLEELEERARPSSSGAPTQASAEDSVPPVALPAWANRGGEEAPSRQEDTDAATGAEDAATAGSTTEHDPDEEHDPGEEQDADPRAPRTGRLAAVRSALRERRTWIVGGIGLVVGAAVAVGLANYPWNAPDRVLHLDPDAGSLQTSDYREWLPPLGIDLDSARVFESVRGFTPWVVDLESGGRCLLLSQSEGSGILNIACAGEGGDPTLDVLPGMWGPGATVPGSTIRLVARGDTVEVWFRGPQPTTDSALAAPVS